MSLTCITLCREANRQGLLGMYRTILDAFRPEICAAMKVRPCLPDAEHEDFEVLRAGQVQTNLNAWCSFSQ